MATLKHQFANNSDQVPFVSTNDVLTIWVLLRNGQPRFGFMVVNLRNRLSGLGADVAGNYQGVVPYLPANWQTPVLIRTSISTQLLRRSVTQIDALPSVWETHTGISCIVSNWLTLVVANELPECTEDLHLPLYHFSAVALPPNMTTVVIFRAGPCKTAILVAGHLSHLILQRADFESGKELQA
jgi:hypothetical protein